MNRVLHNRWREPGACRCHTEAERPLRQKTATGTVTTTFDGTIAF